jgi:Flp pilus assembly pilin Flp
MQTLAFSKELEMIVTRRRRWLGQALVEYVLILAVVSAAAIGVLTTFSQSVRDTTQTAVSALGSAYNQN